MKKILFVCTGNTCRSPMAEAIFNSLSPSDYTSYSAGISCSDGKPVSENSVLALSEIGIVTEHSSVMVNLPLLEQYDMIIGITENHARALISAFPELKERIYAFPCDVGDPYGQNLDAYRKCRDTIYEGIKEIIENL